MINLKVWPNALQRNYIAEHAEKLFNTLRQVAKLQQSKGAREKKNAATFSSTLLCRRPLFLSKKKNAQHFVVHLVFLRLCNRLSEISASKTMFFH